MHINTSDPMFLRFDGQMQEARSARRLAESEGRYIDAQAHADAERTATNLRNIRGRKLGLFPTPKTEFNRNIPSRY